MADDDITIRRASAVDAAALGAVHVQTWREAYTGRMPQPVLDALTPARSTARWEAALASPDGPATTLVAVANGAVIGFATAGPDRSDPAGGIELYSIYVLAAHHRRGVGQRLLDEAIGAHAASLWILDDNPRANDFYQRNGFARTGAHRLDDRFPGGRLREVRMVRTGTDPGPHLRRNVPAADAVRHASSPMDTAPVPHLDPPRATGPVPQTRRERAHPTGPLAHVPYQDTAAAEGSRSSASTTSPAAAWISATQPSADPGTSASRDGASGSARVAAGAPRTPVPPTASRSEEDAATTAGTPARAAASDTAAAAPTPATQSDTNAASASASDTTAGAPARTAQRGTNAGSATHAPARVIAPGTTARATDDPGSAPRAPKPHTPRPSRMPATATNAPASEPGHPAPPDPEALQATAWRPPTGLVERWLPFYQEAHARPELSGDEHATTEQIERALDGLGIAHLRVSETGTVGILRNGEGPVIAFRADIDGLPITEDTGLTFASTRSGEHEGRSVGIMHACGHDTHFTAALAAADHLIHHLHEWSGTLVLVFQPAEETGAGAAAMLAGGLWERAPKPDVVLGQHVMPLPAGVVALRAGSLMSLADTLKVTVRGRQAHGSQPEASVDPVVTAAAAVVRLQTVVARESAPGAGVVVTVGTFHAGAAPNVIPAAAEFTVNIRTPDEPTRAATLEAVQRIIRAEADASRATVDIEQVAAFPRCVNDEAHTARVRGLLGEALGAHRVLELDRPLAGSEDVGALADSLQAPMVFWFFGGFPQTAFADGASPAGNHSPQFAPNARLALTTGITAAVAVLRAYLSTPPQR